MDSMTRHNTEHAQVSRTGPSVYTMHTARTAEL